MGNTQVRLGNGEFHGIGNVSIGKVGGGLGGVVCRNVCADCQATYEILDAVALPRDETRRPSTNFSEDTGSVIRDTVTLLDKGETVIIDGTDCKSGQSKRTLKRPGGAFVCGATVSVAVELPQEPVVVAEPPGQPVVEPTAAP